MQAERAAAQQEQKGSRNPIEVTAATVSLVPQSPESGNLRGVATVVLNHSFQVNGLQVRGIDKNLRVQMPSRQLPDGQRHDHCFPITTQAFMAIRSAVLAAYERAVERQAREQAAAPPARVAGVQRPQAEGPER